MNHTPPIQLPYGTHSVAYYCKKEPTSVVLFIHGFLGNATSTWDEFPALIRERRDFENSDVIFYGYDSEKGQASNNALKFYEFLKIALVQTPGTINYQRRGLPESFQYSKIIFVAHSLGSIVLRRALLNAKAEKCKWLEKEKMVLFAPAHRGARVQKLIFDSLNSFGKVIAGLGFFGIPVLDDLRPESVTITSLIKDTEALLQKNEGEFTKAHTVIWAGNEYVVHNERFCEDPIAKVIGDKTHSEVCKPIEKKFLDPIEFVIKAL